MELLLRRHGAADVFTDDPRMDVFHKSSHAWFVDCHCYDALGFYNAKDPEWNKECKRTCDPNADRYHVIIQSQIDFLYNSESSNAYPVYNNDFLVVDLNNALEKDGVLVLALGNSPTLPSAPDADYDKTIFEYWVE